MLSFRTGVISSSALPRHVARVRGVVPLVERDAIPLPRGVAPHGVQPCAREGERSGARLVVPRVIHLLDLTGAGPGLHLGHLLGGGHALPAERQLREGVLPSEVAASAGELGRDPEPSGVVDRNTLIGRLLPGGSEALDIGVHGQIHELLDPRNLEVLRGLRDDVAEDEGKNEPALLVALLGRFHGCLLGRGVAPDHSPMEERLVPHCGCSGARHAAIHLGLWRCDRLEMAVSSLS